MKNDDDLELLGVSKAAASGCFLFLFGFALLGIAAYYYWYFSLIEESGIPNFGQAPCCIAMPYNFFGKWVTIAMIGLPGVWFVYVAVRELVRKGDNEKR